MPMARGVAVRFQFFVLGCALAACATAGCVEGVAAAGSDGGPPGSDGGPVEVVVIVKVSICKVTAPTIWVKRILFDGRDVSGPPRRPEEVEAEVHDLRVEINNVVVDERSVRVPEGSTLRFAFRWEDDKSCSAPFTPGETNINADLVVVRPWRKRDAGPDAAP
jgi:hypothetical protein